MCQSVGCWSVPETLPWALLCTGTYSGCPPIVLVSTTGEVHRDRDIQTPDLCPPPLAPCVLSAEFQYPRLENAPSKGLPRWTGHGKAGGPGLAAVLPTPRRSGMAP